MNWLERNAFRRAATRLQVSPTETILEFDIGDPLYLILPLDFPTPLPPRARRIDLIATNAALYIHSYGLQRRYEWSDVLECSFQDNFIHWRQLSGHKCQVHTNRSHRPLAEVIAEQIDEYESQLNPVDRENRVTQRASYDAQDRKRNAAIMILNQENQYFRALEFRATVVNLAGEILVASTVCLLDRGVEFVFDSTHHRLLIPYEVIKTPYIDPTSYTMTAGIDDPSYKTFTVQGNSIDMISHWKNDLDQLIANGLT